MSVFKITLGIKPQMTIHMLFPPTPTPKLSVMLVLTVKTRKGVGMVIQVKIVSQMTKLMN